MGKLQGVCATEGCAIEQFRLTLPEGAAEAGSTFHWALIPLCSKMERALKGVNGTLTEERIEEIGQKVLSEYRDEDYESAFIREHPGIVQAVHDCVVLDNQGICELPKRR